MGMPSANPVQELSDSLRMRGFVFSPSTQIRGCLASFGSLEDWDRFADSWNDLAFDTYLADHGRYRRRRYAVYAAHGAPEGAGRRVERAAHQPHYQSLEYNPLQGGIERWFEPITTGDGPSLRTIIAFAHGLFGSLHPEIGRWHVETHQFRIEARPDAPGQPTPEGIHRDGVDYVLVLMIRRTNIVQGTTTIHAPDGALLGSFTLAEPLDAALVDDRRVFHGVTPVEPLDPALPAHRDVLVVTFRRTPDA